MSGFQEKFTFKNLVLPNNVFYAPLAGCSDLPFRKMSSKYQPGLIFCEMVKMDALVRHEPNTYRLLDYEKEMHPIGGQICGSKPEIAGESARIIEDLGFDVVDLNCGCPVDKITKDGSGSGLLKEPDRIGEILYQMVKAVSIPVTVKIRAGWDEQSINAAKITLIAEQAGAASICIHGRTRVQGYTGESNMDYIKEAKEKANQILVIGNGDLFDSESVNRMFSYTKCDAVLISRGSMGQPWLIDEIRNGKTKEFRTMIQSHLLEHIHYINQYQRGKKALLDIRRVSCWYLKKCKGTKELRSTLMKLERSDQAVTIIENFDWSHVYAE